MNSKRDIIDFNKIGPKEQFFPRKEIIEWKILLIKNSLIVMRVKKGEVEIARERWCVCVCEVSVGGGTNQRDDGNVLLELHINVATLEQKLYWSTIFYSYINYIKSDGKK